jgi:hypothetical protein
VRNSLVHQEAERQFAQNQVQGGHFDILRSYFAEIPDCFISL